VWNARSRWAHSGRVDFGAVLLYTFGLCGSPHPGSFPMPKVKTNKTAAKRFKITSTGKMMFEKSRLNHLMMNKKRGGRIRRMNQEGVVCGGERNKVKRLLPNSL
jgi:large subunit ribosomal protein L35